MNAFFKIIKYLFNSDEEFKIIEPEITISDKEEPKTKKSTKKVKVFEDPYKEVYKKSPHQGGTIKPTHIILHDSYGSYAGGVSWIQNPKSKVSYHYLIDKDGNRTQFVYDSKRAWHAGKSKWKGINGLNGCSVGVAFYGNTYKRKVSNKEIDSCARKCIYLMKKFDIPKENILTHQMISPNRKTDTSPAIYKRVLKRIDEII